MTFRFEDGEWVAGEKPPLQLADIVRMWWWVMIPAVPVLIHWWWVTGSGIVERWFYSFLGAFF